MARAELFRVAAQLLLMAIVALVGMTVLASTKTDGQAVLLAFGGLEFLDGAKQFDLRDVRLAYALDTMFPLFYGSGLIVFLTALSGGQNRPLVRILILAVLIAAASDLAENRYIYLFFRDGQVMPAFVSGFTALKYGLLVLSSAALSALLPPREGAFKFLLWILRFALPISIALAFGEFGESGTALEKFITGLPMLLFTVVLVSFVWFSWNMAQPDPVTSRPNKETTPHGSLPVEKAVVADAIPSGSAKKKPKKSRKSGS